MREQAAKLLREFEGSVLVDELQHSTITGIPDFDMDLIKPFTGVKPRRMSEAKEKFLSKWLITMEKNGIIRKSTAKVTSPLLLVPKGESFRVTQDVSKLNECFAAMPAFLPVTREKVQRVGGHKYYFSFDLIHAYFQFRVADNLCSRYAFSTPHHGNWEWNNVLPQGDKNAPAWVNTQLAILFGNLDFLDFYFDDFVGFSDSPEDHLAHVKLFLEKCKQHNVKLSLDKVCVGAPSTKAFGFQFDSEGYMPLDPQREKFLRAPFPEKEQLRAWLGLLNVFRDFIPNLHLIENAFAEVRKKDAKYVITDAM
jgi:hypothetical protein